MGLVTKTFLSTIFVLYFLAQPAANEHADATAGNVVGPTDEVDRCRATSVEHHQQRPLHRGDDVTDAAAAAATAVPQQQQQRHHPHQQLPPHGAAGATVLSAHQSPAFGRVGRGSGGGGGGVPAAGMVVDDGSSGYGSPDSETGLEPATAAAVAGPAVGVTIAAPAAVAAGTIA